MEAQANLSGGWLDRGSQVSAYLITTLFYLKLLHIDVSRAIGVKQLKGLPDLLFLLLGQLWLGGCLLARRGHRTLQGWSLGNGCLAGTQGGDISNIKFKWCFSIPIITTACLRVMTDTRYTRTRNQVITRSRHDFTHHQLLCM